MAGRKRAAEDSAPPTTRSSKAAKTDTSAPTKSAAKGGRRGPKTGLATSAFKSRALPLHVNLTHTPPSIGDSDSVPAAPQDPGYLGNLTLVPSSFATGSYGWKGSKRIVIELANPNAEGEEGADKEKVQVQITINATVLGSKGVGEGEDEAHNDENAKDGEEAKDEDTKNGEAENGAEPKDEDATVEAAAEEAQES